MRWRWAAWVAWCAAKPKNAPTRRMGARAVWSKAARRPSRCGAMRGGHALGAARSRECRDLTNLRTLRRAGDWTGCLRHPLSRDLHSLAADGKPGASRRVEKGGPARFALPLRQTCPTETAGLLP